MLDLVDKTLDQMTFPIPPSVVRTVGFVSSGRLMRQNDWFHVVFDDPVVKGLGSIASISNQTLKSQAVHQLNRLTDVRGLSRGI